MKVYIVSKIMLIVLIFGVTAKDVCAQSPSISVLERGTAIVGMSTNNSELVEASIGTKIAVIFTLSGVKKSIPLSVRYVFPKPILISGKSVAESVSNESFKPGDNAVVWSFEKNEELVSGNWIIQLLHGGKVLSESVFVVRVVKDDNELAYKHKIMENNIRKMLNSEDSKSVLTKISSNGDFDYYMDTSMIVLDKDRFVYHSGVFVYTEQGAKQNTDNLKKMMKKNIPGIRYNTVVTLFDCRSAAFIDSKSSFWDKDGNLIAELPSTDKWTKINKGTTIDWVYNALCRNVVVK